MSKLIINNPKNNFSAIIPPTNKDGSYNGYSRGSMWINILTGVCYLCVNDILNGAI